MDCTAYSSSVHGTCRRLLERFTSWMPGRHSFLLCRLFFHVGSLNLSHSNKGMQSKVGKAASEIAELMAKPKQPAQTLSGLCIRGMSENGAHLKCYFVFCASWSHPQTSTLNDIPTCLDVVSTMNPWRIGHLPLNCKKQLRG